MAAQNCPKRAYFCNGSRSDDRSLDAELIGHAGFAFADAFDLGSMEGIQLPAALALLLRADLASAAGSCIPSMLPRSNASAKAKPACPMSSASRLRSSLRDPLQK